MSVTLHTDKGDIKLELYCEQVPRSTANFLALCASDAYTNTSFHRVVPNFIIQGGDASGTGKSSRAAFAKRLPDEIVSELTFSEPGVVAFANSGKPSSKGVGSQFFITLVPAPHLNGTCTIIGRVVKGVNTVNEIGSGKLANGKPDEPVVVNEISIHANPIADGSVSFEWALP